ncbi:hypothetical protein HRbin34_00477 [bacterium HR34]|nr:hypothetical protein HRbin34_00477 [bacterium HR34]
MNKKILSLKLDCLSKEDLINLLNYLSLEGYKNLSKADLIRKILESTANEESINKFIKEQYNLRTESIDIEKIKKEIKKVRNIKWGVVQGELDRKIQTELVRKTYSYNQLISRIKTNLYNEVKGYVIASWYNYWTTFIIENFIAKHEKVVPTLKPVKGIDLFWKEVPFDLKITYLPKNYWESNLSTKDVKKEIIKWLYENQGAQRFGSENRLFIVLHNKNNPEKSWELKRDFDSIFMELDRYLKEEVIDEQEDLIIFKFRRKTYSAIGKLCLIIK